MLSPKGLSIDRLRSFLAVADSAGIARAAPGDPVRQSQLSRQVKELETALGKPLFDRHGRTLVLTLAGAQLARVVRELHQGLADVAAVAGPLRVSLAAGDSVLRWLVLPALGHLQLAFPDVVLDLRALSAADVARELGEHSLDLGLLRGSEDTGELKTVRLGRISYEVFARRGVDWRALPLAIATSEVGLRASLAQLGPAKLHCETFPQVLQAVRAGFAGVLPTLARVELPPSEFRQHALPALEGASTTLLLAWRKRLDELRPRVTALRRSLEQAVRHGLRAGSGTRARTPAHPPAA